jgi:hypothetical protein
MELVKAMIELEDADLTSMKNAFELAQIMKNANNPELREPQPV